MPGRISLIGPDPRQIAATALHSLVGHRALSLALAGASPGIQQLAYNLITAELAGMGSLDLASTMITAWRLDRRLSAAARTSLAPPYPTQDIRLGSYHVSSSHPEQIDVLLNGVVEATIHASFDLDITIAQFHGVVRSSRLVSVRAGKSEVSGTLTIERVSLPRATLKFNLTVEVPLGRGITLL
jgi:hypothetical protein